MSSIIFLWNICPKGETVRIESPLTAELVVISDCESMNMAPARNFNVETLRDDFNRRTVFAQTPDGKFGLRLMFERGGENFLNRGDLVTVDFNGCSVYRDEKSDALTVSGIFAQKNILSCSKGTPVQPKVRTLPELTPLDINTYVTITDLDVVFKDGSWYNVHEPWTRKMDGWASLLRSTDGRCIYMMLTNACEWRRTGSGVPQGTISVSGVLVHETNRRYGPDMGLYGIRPVFETDVEMLSKKSLWKPIAGWVKPPHTGKTLDFEISGSVEIGKKGIANDRIYNDLGSSDALLWTDSGSQVIVHSGYNSVSKDEKGLVKNGSILFGGSTVDWYDWAGDEVVGYKSFYIQFDAGKMASGHGQFSFEWAAGSTDGNKCWYYPVDWTVECSADGQNWVPLTDAATGSGIVRLHNLPWSAEVIKDSGHEKKLKAGYDTAMGEQQHSFIIPQEVLSCGSKVTVRISPASTLVSRIRPNPSSNYADHHVKRQDKARKTWIRFDSILIDYKK